MIIGPDSVFRKTPKVLDRRQALFIEGIRYSIEMADLAHRRLQRTLPLLTQMQDSDNETPSTVSAMLDAWSIVDSLHRLRGLIEGMSGLKGKKQSPRIRRFLENTENVATLRNSVQHLGTDIHDRIDDKNWTVFGTLSWGVVDQEKNQITACSFMPGAPFGSHPIINPMNRNVWHLPVDSITIERSGISVCLSDAIRSVEAFAASMEKNLAGAYAEQVPTESRGKHHASDLVICLVIQVVAEQIVPAGSQDDPEPGSSVNDTPELEHSEDDVG